MLLPFLEQRARQLDRFAHDGREVERLALELHFAARDARDIQEVLDQAPQVTHLALDDQRFVFEGSFWRMSASGLRSACPSTEELV
jgi:hypothetical protein